MRRIIFVMSIVLAGFVICADEIHAQQTPERLPQVEVPGKKVPPQNSESCGTAASGGSSQSLNCLNQQLKQKVDEVNPASVGAPLNAASPDTKIGIQNLPAVQQQFGPNYGRSVVPYRPAAPVYGTPLGGH
jgi:hypothetical protein